MEYVPYVQINMQAAELQLKIANKRIVKMHKLHMDNEYAEGVRDAMSWVLGLSGAPYKQMEEEQEIAP